MWIQWELIVRKVDTTPVQHLTMRSRHVAHLGAVFGKSTGRPEIFSEHTQDRNVNPDPKEVANIRLVSLIYSVFLSPLIDSDTIWGYVWCLLAEQDCYVGMLVASPC